MKLKTLSSLIVGAALTVAATATYAKDFRSADVHAKDYPTVKAVAYMGDLVSKQTKGKYNIKVFPDSALGSEKDTVEQVKIGGLDMVRVSISTFNNIVPESLVPTMPFLFRDEAHMRKALDGPIGDEILAGFEKAGYIGLAFYDAGSRSIYAKKEIRTPADVKGMKIRVQQSDLWVALIKALGATATPMPAAEVNTAMKTGLVDAAENNWSSYLEFGHYETAKVYNVTEHAITPEVLVFSKKVWTTLSPEDQKIIRKAAKDSVLVERKLWDEQQAKAKATVLAAGCKEFKGVDKAAFQAAVKPVYDQFLTTPELKSLAQRIRDTK